ncbi:peroxisomal biogenesis factor 2 [Blumeria hordei DH14]|uniref:Peroxisomal biogenesis factor 2 n=1 Tax=Blumeria graminis f. sp. hordei (strain DH14) TaxID=546991 RepID=N1JDY7_BLUG1|nr:peroxisomal biogenesis factor 2 [Blumeria hordei DH14]
MNSHEFIRAQQRIAARRAAGEISRQERLSTAKSYMQYDSTRLSRLPIPIHELKSSTVSIWNQIRSREGTNPSFRVGQVDAELLDEELLGLLKMQVGDAFKYFGSHIQNDWAAEIVLVLRSILFKLTIWDHNTTYGAALQNLRYSDARFKGDALEVPSKLQKLAYGVLSVGGSYAWTRWERWLLRINEEHNSSNRTVAKILKLLQTLDTLHSVVTFTSFLVFLVNGRYRTLLDRILKLRLVPINNQASRQVSFEYLNRQLVWHAITEFLLFLLPLVGISRWKRWISRIWKKTKSMIMYGVEDESLVTSGELGFLPERTCAICYQSQNSISSSNNEMILNQSSGQQDITNPYESIPCGCLYCFVCLATILEAEQEDGWKCLRCGKEVRECKPWDGDLIAEDSKAISVSKTVVFLEPELVNTPGDSPTETSEPETSSTNKTSKAECVNSETEISGMGDIDKNKNK